MGISYYDLKATVDLEENPIAIDQKVFQELFDFYFNALCSFGRKFVQAEVIEDIVQDVFISFWQQRKNFTNRSAAKSFFYKSVRNKCLNHIRDEIVEQKRLQSSVELATNYEDLVIEEEVFNTLYQEIKNLPLASQQVMLLALNGLKNPAIAAELGISINTVKTQKKIAYAKLKDRISHLMHSILISL